MAHGTGAARKNIARTSAGGAAKGGKKSPRRAAWEIAQIVWIGFPHPMRSLNQN
jgi:hypothetical protein